MAVSGVDKFITRWQSASGSERATTLTYLCFIGRGAWKKRLPQIIDTLVAVGRVRRMKDGLTVIA